MSNGITTFLSTDLTNSNITKQSTTNLTQASNGGTDPGGDPTGDPIPVGDGWGLLVLFGVCYAAYKNKSLIKTIVTKREIQ